MTKPGSLLQEIAPEPPCCLVQHLVALDEAESRVVSGEVLVGRVVEGAGRDGGDAHL